MIFMAKWLPLSLLVSLSVVILLGLYFTSVNALVKWLLGSLLIGLVVSSGLLIGTLIWIRTTQEEFVVIYSLWRVLAASVVLGGTVALLGLGIRALHKWIFCQPF